MQAHRSGQELLGCRRSLYAGTAPRAVTGPPRFLGEPSRGYAIVPVTPDDPSRLACRGVSGAAPRIIKLRTSSLRISRLNSVASPLAVYASRRALPHAMQHSLPAGGLRLCRTGFDPAGSHERFLAHRFLLYQDLSWRNITNPSWSS